MPDPVILPFPFTPDTPLSSSHREYALAKLRHAKARKRVRDEQPDTVIDLLDADQAEMNARDRYFQLLIEAERAPKSDPCVDEPESWFR